MSSTARYQSIPRSMFCNSSTQWCLISLRPLRSKINSQWTITTEQGGFGRLHGCCWPGSISVSGEVSNINAPDPLLREPAAQPTKKSRALPEWLSPTKTSPTDAKKTKVKPKTPIASDQGANREEDPLSQDLQPSQSSLFDDLSESQDATNKEERQKTKRKRSEDEATHEIT